ncbi:hypothetical protein QN362_08200 [Actimicrobium sp. CCC2.4]|uniref:hypothetical protein n=1 Tax=Actimicrobium sp. CCC2.4 TaxID=3048606 RepID=UPI002AC8B52D|nr:hypothetical protein [Actimicrobium sp. CCC2.4]MEB0135312.1 hypothetical protein [Actimicrobium sp. CCC2.4]WPX31101.1 hypothetical protein RHM62_12660 [Actimicrobium sp. CCC2.4]
MMHAGMFTVRRSGHLAGLVLVAVSCCTSLIASAQMQIPNPLIRPRGLINPATGDVPPLPGATGTSPRTTIPAGYPPTGAVTDNPLQRELTEQKERFAGFYVSAIVGKQAVLRRSAAQRVSTSTQPAPAVGTSMAPVPLGAQSQAMSARNDALMLTDGESFDATGNVGSLYARVSNRQVVIFHVADGSTAIPKPGTRYPIVFVGELETSGNPAQPAIVLERPDPLYKRSITVEVKARSASAPVNDAQNQNQNQSLPGALPAPLQ